MGRIYFQYLPRPADSKPPENRHRRLSYPGRNIHQVRQRLTSRKPRLVWEWGVAGSGLEELFKVHGAIVLKGQDIQGFNGFNGYASSRSRNSAQIIRGDHEVQPLKTFYLSRYSPNHNGLFRVAHLSHTAVTSGVKSFVSRSNNSRVRGAHIVFFRQSLTRA